MSTTTDPTPAVEVPPTATFPVRVEVPAMELLLRDQDALDDLNRLLAQIRRLPQREPAPPVDSDAAAQIRSLIWFDEQRGMGKFPQYDGMFVAIRGEQVIDADADGDALGRRLEARGESVFRGPVVVRYAPTPAQWRARVEEVA